MINSEANFFEKPPSDLKKKKRLSKSNLQIPNSYTAITAREPAGDAAVWEG